MIRTALASFCLLALGMASPSQAHFVQLIPSQDVLPNGGAVSLDMRFTHPFDGGPVMEMLRPQAFGMLRNGEKVDLLDSLTEVAVDGMPTWTSHVELAEPGPALFHVTPQPYWEPAEGKFIVHHTKVLVDSHASGEDWDALVGLPVEIRPLTRPTGLWAGNSFAGVVLRNGAPVPFAEIEIEYLNDGGVVAPNDAFVTQVIRADAQGTFGWTMPWAGWWGFAALIEGDAPMTSPEGAQVPVEIGGLIWVRTSAVERR